MTDGSSMKQTEILATETDLVRTRSERTENWPEQNGNGTVETGNAAPNEHQQAANSVDHPTVPWQTAMKRAIRSSKDLARLLDLPVDDDALSQEPEFPTFVPLEFLSRIEKGNPLDPLLLQVMPTRQESAIVDGFESDPVGDMNALSAPGLLHKYQGRALVIATGACGVHCRYCFRREFPYTSVSGQSDAWQNSIDYIRSNRSIDEVILSGGDPLTLVDEKLFQLIEKIESIEHVKRLRIHTRMPIVIPQRVTESLVGRLSQSPLAVWFVVHANHVAELSDSVLASLSRLIDSGIPVLNQAVLLRGVNDQAQTLIDLCRKLVDHRIGPYYLHQLDRVRGASHFEVPVKTGLELMQQLRRSLPGYAVPTYVYEQSGEASKTPLT